MIKLAIIHNIILFEKVPIHFIECCDTQEISPANFNDIISPNKMYSQGSMDK